MNKISIFAILIIGSMAFSAGTPVPKAKPAVSLQGIPGATATPWVIEKWSASAVPWNAWFKNNNMVTDKGKYVHFFWNAQDYKVNFEVKEKKTRLAEAALELVKRLYPADAKADLIKLDIVYVLERDEYGLPKWDSLKKVAHIEFLKSKAPKQPAKGELEFTEALFKKTFDKFELF